MADKKQKRNNMKDYDEDFNPKFRKLNQKNINVGPKLK